MKKLEVTIMVLMVCTIGATVIRADLVAGYPFNGSLCDCSGNDYDGQWCSPIGPFSMDGPPPGGEALCLDGDNCVILPLGADNPLDGSGDYTVAMWFKVSDGEGDVLISSSRDDNPDNHAMAVFVNGDGGLNLDYFYISAWETEATGLDDGTWHHMALVFTPPTTMQWYIDGNAEESGEFTGEPFDIPDIADDTLLVGDTLNETYPFEDFGDSELVGCIANVGLFNHALTETEIGILLVEPVCWCGPIPCPFYAFDVDPNVMMVYEAGETIGDFDVSLNCEPTGVITVTVDPNNGNGPNDDLTLIGGSGPQNRITLTFDPNSWNIPQTVVFQAVDDELEEGPDINERHYIRLTTACADPNWDGRTRDLTVTVQDNDYADILFTFTLPERSTPKMPVTGPVQLWEEPRWLFGSPFIKWRKIGVMLQVPPAGGPVKLQAVVEGEVVGDNLPLTDPCLPYAETDDPNGLIFTAANYNVSQDIKIWGNDDTVLQAIGATSEGDQNYQATLVFTVIDDGGDERFAGMERTVQFDIEDNECGAYGISYLDVGNPNAFTDPNFLDEDGNPLPDCQVDIYDLVEIAFNWLKCTNPQDENCESML